MDYFSYSRTQAVAEQRERAKQPGQKFCDEVGWKLTSSKYKEIQRPDRITWVGGTQYRTITPTTHVWYKNNNNNQHIWIEFSGNAIIIKVNIRVTSSSSPSGGYFLHPDSSNYSESRTFTSPQEACNFLLSLS